MTEYIYDENLEQFRVIAGYPDYEIGDQGNVRSLKFGKVRVLKPRVNPNGYLIVGLCKNSKIKTSSVHRLVAMHFIENPENKPQVNHINGKLDNRVCSLEWSTCKENIRHSWENGLSEKVREATTGENHGACKLTDIQCEEIRKLYASGQYTQQHIADDYGCSRRNISHIITGKSRKRPTPAKTTNIT